MNSMSSVRTSEDAPFAAITVDIVEPDLYTSFTKVRPRSRLTGVTEAHTPADNVSVVQVPVIIADGSPGSVVEHLHPAFTIGATPDKSYIFPP